ncbi:MAG: hypothetical protein ABIZ04_14505 [Opitutus sp.]
MQYPTGSRVAQIKWSALCRWIFVSAAMLAASAAFAAETPLGSFSDHLDVGEVKLPGSATYDAAKDSYSISSSGANMWFKTDSFHFVWKKVSGDTALSAAIAFVGQSSEPHRKAFLMIRQTLDADSPYADVVVHGDGLTSLQFREEKGGITREVQTNVTRPKKLRIDKIGTTIYMSLGTSDEPAVPSGCSVRLPLTDSYYIGIGVCAHQANRLETALFSEVKMTAPSLAVTQVRSSLETIVVASTDRRSVYHTTEHIEAPNWSRDGTSLIFNGGGRIYQLALGAPSEPRMVDTGFAVTCNNDHGLSPDGSQLVISDQTKDGLSRIYTLPSAGGTPKEITPLGPSYWHGWSPDGKRLAYCAERKGKFGIFTIPANGGEETRLTTAPGLDDGPDYSPDGRYIYFNSDRGGHMQIWRMEADGSNPEQMSRDEQNNWFPHPSPDGKWVAFLSYAPEVKGHPADKDVTLRLMSTATGTVTTLAKLFGGQGTINVPSWSPDSTKLAYVRYQPKI